MTEKTNWIREAAKECAETVDRIVSEGGVFYNDRNERPELSCRAIDELYDKFFAAIAVEYRNHISAEKHKEMQAEALKEREVKEAEL